MGAHQAPLTRKIGKLARRERTQRFYDTVAIALIALGTLAVAGLLSRDTGVLGNALGDILRLFLGIGSFFVPLLFWCVGVIFLFGGRRFSRPHVLVGSSLIYLSLVGWISNADADGNWFSLGALQAGGGYVGAAIGWLMSAAFGSADRVVFAAAITIGIVFVINTPVAQIVRYGFGAWIAGKAAARNGAKRLSRVGSRTSVRNSHKPRGESRAVVHMDTDRSEAERRKPSVVDSVTTIPTSEVRPKIRLVGEPTVTGAGDNHMPIGGYDLPDIALLREPKPAPKRLQAEINNKIEVLERTLDEFGIGANVNEIAHGPTVTRYEIQLAPGIKVSKITSLADNLAMALAAIHVRVEAPIPGKSAIGVEVPNDQPQIVTLREVIDRPEFWNADSRLLVALGKDVGAQARFADLSQMPHLLIGGATNSGKSVGLAAIISSLIYRNTPKEVRFVLIDPKRVELSLFDGIPHLMCPVVKDAKLVPAILRSVIREMEKRYDMFSQNQVRNIDGFNKRVAEEERLSYIVVVIDELADLMIQAAAEIETAICRLAQLARATGIHLVVATQRPSVDVITGTIKANISSRIAFTVASQVDSRTILDMAGAEGLIGRGDMLFMPIDAAKPFRIQGCYVSDAEQEAIVTHWKGQETPIYTLQPQEEETGGRGGEASEKDDVLYTQAVRLVVSSGQASTSMLQRRFRIGYGRAARLLDTMETRGIVGPLDGPRPREILLSPLDLGDYIGDEPESATYE